MKRRLFLHNTLFAALGACTGARKETGQIAGQPRPALPRLRDVAGEMTDEDIVALLKVRARHHMAATSHCAQATYLALSDVFDFGSDVDIRALTALPGIAERGGTCGAITSALLAIGMVYGSNRPGDRRAYDTTVRHSNRFMDRFVETLGQTKCRLILKDALGADLDLRKSEDLHRYRALDGPAHCSAVVANAAVLAAEVILPAIRSPETP